MSRTTSGYTITQAELMAMARERFGSDTKLIAFQCPNCGDIATLKDFIDGGSDPGKAGQECIGRTVPGGRGCKFVAYGLIPGPWRIVMPGAPEAGGEPGPEPDTFIVCSFPLAPAPEPKHATAADMTISPYGRGTCPELRCQRDISLTKKGVLRVHGREKDLGNRWQNCPGSGKAPVDQSTKDGAAR